VASDSRKLRRDPDASGTVAKGMRRGIPPHSTTVNRYARVSTTGQTLAAQLDQLTAAGCAPIFREPASGACADRRQVRRMNKVLALGDAVTVTRTSIGVRKDARLSMDYGVVDGAAFATELRAGWELRPFVPLRRSHIEIGVRGARRFGQAPRRATRRLRLQAFLYSKRFVRQRERHSCQTRSKIKSWGTHGHF
jgi:hypothetical protein